MSAVSTEGEMYSCHRFVGMKDYVIGDARSGLEEVKIVRFFRKVEDAYKPTRSQCMARLVCGGMCYYTAADGAGGFDSPYEVACNSYRRYLKSAVGFLLQMRDMDAEDAISYQKLLSGYESEVELPDS